PSHAPREAPNSRASNSGDGRGRTRTIRRSGGSCESRTRPLRAGRFRSRDMAAAGEIDEAGRAPDDRMLAPMEGTFGRFVTTSRVLSPPLDCQAIVGAVFGSGKRIAVDFACGLKIGCSETVTK